MVYVMVLSHILAVFLVDLCHYVSGFHVLFLDVLTGKMLAIRVRVTVF